MKISLTDKGKAKIEQFLSDCKKRQKEILTARLDTCNEIQLPDIFSVIEKIESDPKADAKKQFWANCKVTDHYSTDHPLHLKEGLDYFCDRNKQSGYFCSGTIKTVLGTIRVYVNDDMKNYPGFSIMFEPKGYGEEIDIATAFVEQGKEGDKKMHIAAWANPCSEDCTYVRTFGEKELNDLRKSSENY